MAGYLRAVADRLVVPPPARGSPVTRAAGSGWPLGLPRAFDGAVILLRYTMRESACAVVGPRP